MAFRGEDEHFEWLDDQRSRILVEDGNIVAKFTLEYKYPLTQFKTWLDVVDVIQHLEIELINDPKAQGWFTNRFLSKIAQANGFDLDVQEVLQRYQVFHSTLMNIVEVQSIANKVSLLTFKNLKHGFSFDLKRDHSSSFLDICLPQVGYIGKCQKTQVTSVKIAHRGNSYIFTIPASTVWLTDPVKEEYGYGPYSRIIITSDFSAEDHKIVHEAMTSLMEDLSLEWV